MTDRHHGASDWLGLLFLVVVWGSAFGVIKISVETIAPMWTTGLRLVVAALVLLPVALLAGGTWPRFREVWRWIAVLAVLGNALPFFLVAWAEQYVDSGVVGVFMAFMPLATIVIAHVFLPGEPLGMMKGFGFVLGFAGVVMLIGPDVWDSEQGVFSQGVFFGGSAVDLLARGAALGAALCYAVTAVVARRAPAMPLAWKSLATVCLATVMVVPMAAMTEPLNPGGISAESLIAVIILGVFPTGMAALVYFRVIDRAGASFMSLTNYLVPIWAVVLGVAALGEMLEGSVVVALALILCGIAISRRSVSGGGHRPTQARG